MTASAIANSIRNLRFDKYIDIMLIGDHAKYLLLPLWGTRTDLPNVYQSRFTYGSEELLDTMICSLWNLPSNTDATKRMFHLDGNEDTGFDYCIIVISGSASASAASSVGSELLQYLAIRDNIQRHQHQDKKCELVVLILKTTTQSQVVDYCKDKHIHHILVDKDCLDKIRNLPEKLCDIIYKHRKKCMAAKVQALLSDKS